MADWLASVKVVILMPTRGLIFTRVFESLWKNVDQIRSSSASVKLYTTEFLPIPDCFNQLAKVGMSERNTTHLFFIEEDIVLPYGALVRLLRADGDIVSGRYVMKDRPDVEVKADYAGITMCGTGCLLVKAHVFRALEEPWFSSDFRVAVERDGHNPPRALLIKEPTPYGGHDFYFCYKAYEKGFKVEFHPDVVCEHLKLEALGRPFSNSGLHKILSFVPREV